MYTAKHIKQSIMMLSFAALATGCGGGGTGTDLSAAVAAVAETVAEGTTAPTTAAVPAAIPVVVEETAPTVAVVETTPATTTSTAVVAPTAPATTSTAAVAPTAPATTETPTEATAPVATVEPAAPVTTVVAAPAVAKALQSGEVRDSATGEPLANVEVRIGDAVTTTDIKGFYKLTDIPVSDKAVITFTHEHYFKNSKTVAIKQYSEGETPSQNHIEFALEKYIQQHSDHSRNERWWRYSFGIKIPGDIYTDSKGSAYEGNTVASVVYKNAATEEGRDIFPGAYEGKDTNGIIVPFVSYGFMVVDLKDESGAELGVSDEITLTFHSAEGATAESMPLWYYDYSKSIWVEEGSAIRLPDGKYEGTVSHPGTWSLSQPIEDEPGIYRNRIVYPDGTPVKNLRVHATGKNWIRTDLSTDENGVFEIEVIPGETFSLKVYNYEDKTSAKYYGTIVAVASGEVVDNIE